MRCPRDSTALIEAKVEHSTCHHCPTCTGLLVHVPGTRISGIKFSDLKRKLDTRTAPPESGLPSPANDEPMYGFDYEGVHLDYCAETNSIWLDAGELEKVARNIRKKTEKKKQRQRSKNSPSSSESVLDAVGNGLIDFIGYAIAALFSSL